VVIEDEGDLKKLHSVILRLSQQFEPPHELLTNAENEYEEWLHGRSGEPYSSESRNYYIWLALAVKLLRPRNILELGNWYGASTLMMYSSFSDDLVSFTSVDIVKKLDLLTDEVWKDQRTRFVFGNDLNLSIYERKLPLDIDFLFMDSLHELHHLVDEWYIYRHLCVNGALVVLDDIYLENLRSFWDRLPYPKLDISEDCHKSGFGIFIYSSEEAETISSRERIDRAYDASLEVAYARLEHASNQAKSGQYSGGIRAQIANLLLGR